MKINEISSLTLNNNRQSVIQKLIDQEVFDILVVGGGIHGASFARIASEQGFKVALLERYDYANATSSRSSKMAHGGLRYLEMFDFQQVFEGIKAREELFEIASHLVKPIKFLIPVPEKNYFFRIKLAIGLFLYDLMVKKSERKHKWITIENALFSIFKNYKQKLMGCFEYTDGILDDSRLVIENILAARLNSAVCLNYAEVNSIEKLNSDVLSVSWKDKLANANFKLNTRTVINCTGPWANSLNTTNKYEIKYSRGTHLIFDVPWNKPALFLPLEEKTRYYFVWPHYAGTMVGTTEREVSEPSIDTQPSQDEIEEILKRIESDLPDSGLNRESLHYAFAGDRTLPIRKNNTNTARISRKHIWDYNDRMLTLLGGKLTTANWTAEEGLKIINSKVFKRELKSKTLHKLPGAEITEKTRSSFIEQAKSHKVSEENISRLLNRYGARVEKFITNPSYFSSLDGTFLQGEVMIALLEEQAETLDDIMRRRVGMEYFPNNGLDLLDQVIELAYNHGNKHDYAKQKNDYIERISKIQFFCNLISSDFSKKKVVN
jgi:glycerol-3-phosphate dehydrogenase